MGVSAAYLIDSEHRDNYDYTPEASRRARGFAVYAALRSLGRRGLAELVDRCCEHAALFARLLRDGGAEVLNDVVLNQVLVACAAVGDRARAGRRHVLGRRHGLAGPRRRCGSPCRAGRRPTDDVERSAARDPQR